MNARRPGRRRRKFGPLPPVAVLIANRVQTLRTAQRVRLGDRSLQAADAVAGAGLVGFGALLGVRTLRDG